LSLQHKYNTYLLISKFFDLNKNIPSSMQRRGFCGRAKSNASS
jgi:hypothetical protein